MYKRVVFHVYKRESCHTRHSPSKTSNDFSTARLAHSKDCLRNEREMRATSNWSCNTTEFGRVGCQNWHSFTSYLIPGLIPVLLFILESKTPQITHLFQTHRQFGAARTRPAQELVADGCSILREPRTRLSVIGLYTRLVSI